MRVDVDAVLRRYTRSRGHGRIFRGGLSLESDSEMAAHPVGGLERMIHAQPPRTVVSP